MKGNIVISYIIHVTIGILACLDGFMNIAMEQTEEYIDGQLKNRYGDCFLRGNNGKPCQLLIVIICFSHLLMYQLFMLSLVLYICAAKPKK